MVSVITLKIERSDVASLKELGYGEGCRPIEAMHKREMAIRTKELRMVDKSKVEKLMSKTGGKLADFVIAESTEWAISFQPLKNLRIYYLLQRYSPELEDEVFTFYGKETSNTGIPVDDLYDFTRLYSNALVRASRDR